MIRYYFSRTLKNWRSLRRECMRALPKQAKREAELSTSRVQDAFDALQKEHAAIVRAVGRVAVDCAIVIGGGDHGGFKAVIALVFVAELLAHVGVHSSNCRVLGSG